MVILWCSATFLLALTIYAWQSAQDLKVRGDPHRLRRVYLAAAVCGAIGTACTVLAALI